MRKMFLAHHSFEFQSITNAQSDKNECSAAITQLNTTQANTLV